VSEYIKREVSWFDCGVTSNLREVVSICMRYDFWYIPYNM